MTRTRVVLLTGQTFSLGLMLVLVIIPASALFLAEYGSRGLPYTYLGIPAVGVPSSMALAAALRRWRLPFVASRVVALVTLIFFVSWLALRADAIWVSAVLLVLFLVVLQIGFVLVGGQAGRLFDVRQIKSLFPRVTSGFAAGLLAGGLLGPPLLGVLGSTEDLLVPATAAGVMFLIFVVATGRRYAPELALIPQPLDVVRPPLRVLLAKRFVVVIFVYQVFSAMGSQLLDFMVFDRAAARYSGAEDLARVISVFTAVLNGTNILFLAVAAGYLLRRFGLRLGVNANPMIVTVLVGTIVVASLPGDATSLGLFLFVAGSRVADITLTDGMTRTSVNATYQALPLADRLAVQATVEGVGVPLAIGASGLLLIVADLAGLGFTFVAVSSFVLCLVWTVAGLFVYRGYAARLVATLRQRAVDPAALTVDGATLAVVDGLLASADAADIRLGLDVLTGAEHAGLEPRLVALSGDARPAVRADALERLADLDAIVEAESGRRGLRDPDPAVRSAAVRLLARHGSLADVEAVAALTADPDVDVELAALVATRGRGDAAVAARAAARLRELAASARAADRRRVAGALATRIPVRSSGLDADGDFELLLLADLAADMNVDVREAAIVAAGVRADPALLPVVLAGLADAATASAATAALAAFGGALADAADRALASDAPSPTLIRLVRACATTPEAAAVLTAHSDHADREVQLAVLSTLRRLHAAIAASPSDGRVDDDSADAAGAALKAAGEHAARSLAAIEAVRSTAGAEHLVRALHDEVSLATDVVVAALALRYDERAVTRSIEHLRGRADGERAFALEMLEVTLSKADRAVAFPLLQPGLSVVERLARSVSVPPLAGTIEALEDLAVDARSTWRRPWLRACALYAIGAGAHHELSTVVRAAVDDSDPDIAATAAWALDRLTHAETAS